MEFILLAIPIGIVIGALSSVIAGRRRGDFWPKLGYWLLTILLTILPALLFINFSVTTADRTLAIGVYTLIELLFMLIIFRLLRRRAVWISFLALVICFGAGTGILYRHQAYVDSLITVSENTSVLWDYKPSREGNKLALINEPTTLTITEDLPVLDGATALYPVYAAFANAVYPAELIDEYENLLCSRTTWAYERLVDGEADVIFVAGPSDEQLQYAADKGEEMVFTPIGRECFVFFVNAQNPVNGLTVDQIRGIYSGEITNWKTLGADVGKIRPFQRDEGSGSQSALVRFMGDTPLMEPAMENRVDGMGGIIERTADYRNFPNAIGYSFRFYSTEMVQNGEIKLLEINGIAPTKENILNNTYPISDSFYAVTLASNDNPNVPLLIDWILSEQGQQLIDQTGYVALK